MAETVLRKHRHSTKKKIARAWHGFGAIGKIAGGLTAFKLKRGEHADRKVLLSGERFGFVIRRWRFWNPDLSFHLGTGASHKRKAHATV